MMPESITPRTHRSLDELLRGRSHPVLAIAAFFGAFLFAALPFIFGTDNPFVVAASMIGCLSSTILFIRLLIGKLGLIKWILLGIAAYLCYVAGDQWYVIVLLTGGTILCSLLIARWIGDFVPVVRGARI